MLALQFVQQLDDIVFFLCKKDVSCDLFIDTRCGWNNLAAFVRSDITGKYVGLRLNSSI